MRFSADGLDRSRNHNAVGAIHRQRRGVSLDRGGASPWAWVGLSGREPASQRSEA